MSIRLNLMENYNMATVSEQIQEIYIGLLGRAADKSGLDYWAAEINAGTLSIEQLRANIVNEQPEYAAGLGQLTRAQLVNTLYENLFERAAEAEGLDYWVNGAGATVNADQLVLALSAGASAADRLVLDNKTDAAEYYTANVTTYTADSATAAIGSVDSTMASVDASKAATDNNTQSSGQTFTLTTGIDNLVGTTNNDTFAGTNTATSAVLGGLDKVDGGAGSDTLSVADTATAAGAQFGLPTGFSVSNVETINLTTNGGILSDVSAITGLTAINTVAAGTANTSVTAAGTTDVATTTAGNTTTTIAGGKSVSVTASATGTGATSVSGKDLTAVAVKGGGVVTTIDNLGGAAGTTTSVGTTMTSVTLDNVAGATAAVKGAAITDLTVKNQDSALATTVTNGTSTALTVNVDNAGYNAAGAAVGGVTVAAGAKAATITVNATGSKSNVTVSGAAAKTLKITGSADLNLAQLATATTIDGSAATGGLTLNTLAAGTTAVSTGAGKDSFELAATAKATVDTGAGNDTVTLASAVAAGSTVNLGAGDDKVLVNGGSVAASTATAVTSIDAGEGTDSVSAALINAANAAQFKNFESLDASAAATLDVELMTGSTISGLTLSGGAGGATLTNVASGVGLSVSGTNAGVTTIGVKDATKASSTADSFTTTLVGEAAAAATAAAPTTHAAGTIVTNGVEALNIVSGGTGFVTNTMAVTDSALQTLTVTGDKGLALTFVGTNGTAVTGATDTVNGVSLIDASAAEGVINVNTTNVGNVANAGLTVKTGSAKDVITLAQKATVDAGAEADTITSAAAGGTFTGGAGNDTFDVTLAVATGTTEATYNHVVIADAAAGDKIDFAATSTGAFNGTKVTLGAGVTTLDTATASAVGAVNTTQWFQYAGNTYIVSNDADAAFDAGDTVVELTGLVDLSNSTMAATVLTL
jgi:S-layer protein